MKRLYLQLLSILLGCAVFAQQGSPFTFALITDTHVGSPENNEDLRRSVQDINLQKDIAFVIVSGDVTEFGSYDELRTAKQLLNDLRVPYYAIPGNHD